MQNHSKELVALFPVLSDYGITSFGKFICRKPDCILEKGHHGSSFEIRFMDNGTQPYYVTDTRENAQEQLYILNGSNVLVTQPYESHSTGGWYQLRGQLYWLQFNSECSNLLNHPKNLSDLLKEELYSLDNRLISITPSVIEKMINAYDLLQNADDPRCLFRGCELLTLFILELADLNRKNISNKVLQKPLSAKASDAVSFIQNNLLDPDLNVEMVAHHLGLSRTYAITFFRREVGVTPHEFILRSKIEYACNLLLTHTIIETSGLLNFSSSNHFSKVFKEQTGISPSEYINSKK